MPEKTCKHCGVKLPNAYQYLNHRRKQHPETIRERKNDPSASPAMDRYLDAKKTMRESLRDLESERDTLQQKLLEYDDKIAEIKKLC